MIRTENRSAERGFTLAEVLTATAIFALIFVAALLIYDRSNRVYKQGVEAADMQQNTRVAFDKITADLRMTGFDFDRDGNPTSSLANPWQANTPYSPGNLVQPDPPNGFTYQAVNSGTSVAMPFTTWDETEGTQTVEPGGTLRWENKGSLVYQQPDEQIEYAGKSAIVIRANLDYDYELGTCAGLTPCENGREPALQSVFFPVVTTDNDEIVVYALKPVNPPATPPPAMTLYADLHRPRDVSPGSRTKEQQVSIPDVDLCPTGCNNPPYTLYRFTWDDDGNLVSTPIADNIRSMEFRYFKDTAATPANEVTTLPNGAGQYDGAAPDATVAERDTRAEIRAIRLNLVGMSPSMDGDYTDATDTVAPKYRKYPLETLIVPRNIGRHGMREFTTLPPDPPTLQAVCAGSCNAVYLSWIAPQTGGDVETYNILYDTDNCTSGFAFAEDAGHNVEGYAAQWVTPGQTYFFAVQAINKYGSASSACVSINVINRTRPVVVNRLKASGGNDPNPLYVAQENQIQLFWPPASANDPGKKTTMCNTGTRDEDVMPGAERRFYRIYRSKKSTVQPGDADTTVVMDEFKIPQPTLGGTDMTWFDTAVANCQDYYYRIRVVDFCARQPAYNEANDATIGESSSYFPDLGIDGIRGRASTVKQPAQVQGLAIAGKTVTGAKTDYTFTWNAVTKNEGDPTGPTIYVDTYRIEVKRKNAVTGIYDPVLTQDVTGGALTYQLKNLDTPDLLTPYKFTIFAVTCSDSPESNPVYDPCLFGGVGAPTINIAPDTSYGGSGTSPDPWIINDPAAFLVTSNVDMSQITVQFTQGGTPVGTSSTGSVAAGVTATIPIPGAAADGVVTQAVFSFTDSSGSCTVGDVKYVMDVAPGTCSLIDKVFLPAPTPPVQTFTPASPGGRTVLGIHNTSTNQLKLLKLIITWNASGSQRSAEQLTTVDFPTGTVTANCPTPAASAAASKVTSVVPPATQFIAPSSNISVTINFREPGGNQSISSGDPVTKVCVQYQLPSGDILTCPIIPNDVAACTVPGSSCQ